MSFLCELLGPQPSPNICSPRDAPRKKKTSKGQQKTLIRQKAKGPLFVLSVIITAGLCLLPCVFAANALRLFICLGAAAPAPTQKGAGAVSPHTLPVQKCKGSAFGLHPCLLPAAREGDHSAPAALALPSEIGRTLRALPPSGCRPRPLSFVLLHGAACGTSPHHARCGT